MSEQNLPVSNDFISARLRLLVPILILAIFLITACSRTAETSETVRPVPANADLPSDTEKILGWMSSANLAGANLVITDGKRIYFNDRENRFVKARADGSDSEILVDSYAAWPFMLDEQIFFVDGSPAGRLSKLMIDGSNRVRIGQRDLSNLIVRDDQIFAIEMPEGIPVRFRTDGSGREVIFENSVTSMIAAGSNIYMAGKTAEDGIMRYDPDTGNRTRLAMTTAGNLQYWGDYLYFSDLQNQFYVSALDLTRTPESDSPRPILELSLEKPFIICEGRLYYIDGSRQQQLFSLALNLDEKLDAGQALLEIDDAVGTFSVLPPFIYYQRPDQNRLYRIADGSFRPEPVS